MTVQAPEIDEAFAVPAGAGQLDRAAAALRERGIVVHVVDTPAEARSLVVGQLLPSGQPVFTANSETLKISGIAADIDDSGKFVSVRATASEVTDIAERMRIGAAPEVVVGSVHAVTEDGLLLAASASGSQLASYASGARKVIWVVGAQKVVPDLETGLRRIRTHSLPREWRRTQEAYGQASFIGKILIVEREAFPDRATMVLIREPIGF